MTPPRRSRRRFESGRMLTAMQPPGPVGQVARDTALDVAGARCTTASGLMTASAGCRRSRFCRGLHQPESLSSQCLLDREAYGRIRASPDADIVAAGRLRAGGRRRGATRPRPQTAARAETQSVLERSQVKITTALPHSCRLRAAAEAFPRNLFLGW